MIDNVGEIFLVVAEKFGLNHLFDGNNVYYKIEETAIEHCTGDRYEQFEELIRVQNSTGNVYGFYCNSFDASLEMDVNAFGIDINFLPYNDNDPDELAEMIVLHEIAHYIQMRGIRNQFGIELAEHDQRIGEKIGNHQYHWHGDFQHNAEFVAILNNLIRRIYSDSYAHKLRIAMSKTMIDIEIDITDGGMNEQYFDCELG